MNHTKKTYTYQEAADLLGISKRSIYRKAKRGDIKTVSPTGVPRVHAEEIDRITSGRDK